MSEFRSLYSVLTEMVEAANISYMDACIAYAEKTGVEVELLGDIITSEPMLKEAIRKEAMALNYLRKEDSIDDFS